MPVPQGMPVAALTLLLCLTAGCGGDARLELSAADALNAATDQMELALREYHQEVVVADDHRETAAIGAFIARVQAAPADAGTAEGHAADFKAALARIRADRTVEFDRRAAAADNVAVLREVARGMQRLALDSLTLQDEMRRYLQGWIELRQRAKSEHGANVTAANVAAPLAH